MYVTPRARPSRHPSDARLSGILITALGSNEVITLNQAAARHQRAGWVVTAQRSI
jgi:hypothetical protein